jgi:hypothetical protein
LRRRLLVALLGVLVLSDVTWRKKRQEKEIRDDVEDVGRFVDFGVLLRVVRLDMVAGAHLVPGFDDLKHLEVHRERFGGIVDTKASTPHLVGPSQEPVEWFCSEDQYALIVHAPHFKPRIIAYGSEGGGKTEALVRWHWISGVLRYLGEGREGGQTAPTAPRLERFHEALAKAWRPEWYTLNKETGLYQIADGSRVRALSTHQSSKAEGARVQGYSWAWEGADELQDHLDKNADIEARGRAAPKGIYYRLATATAKDSPAWRTFRDGTLLATDEKGEKLWSRADLLGTRSPFVAPKFWADLKGTLSPREYERRVLARDVGPERATYTTWARDENLRMVPLGAEDITAKVLAHWGPNLQALVGFDPGKLFDVSLILKAYRWRGLAKHTWFVVDEATTEQSTTESHVRELLTRLRDKWDCNRLGFNGRAEVDGAQALVRADPYSDSNVSDRPDRSVYTIFRQHGLLIHPAVYATKTDTVKPGTVPREGGIDMINGLLCNAKGERRLFVKCDDRRTPCAPRLVEAIETSERDEFGKAEKQRKDVNDQSHWPAALRYALWVLEKPRMSEVA